MRESWPLFFVLLLGACGGEKPSRLSTKSDWRISLGPKVLSALEGREARLQAWGPWWAPLWSKSLPVGKKEIRIDVDRPADHLHWVTLEAEGRILCGAAVKDGLSALSYHLDFRQITIPRSSLSPDKVAIEPIPLHSGKLPAGFPGGGLAIRQGDRAALWAIFSPDLSLGSFWFMPWRSRQGKYAVVQVENRIDSTDWGRPQEEWDLDGKGVVELKPRPVHTARLFSTGFSLTPLAGPEAVPPALHQESKARLLWWGPGWETGILKDGEFVVGHADWRRHMVTIPEGEGFALFPLWPAAPLPGLVEDPPQALWSLKWLPGKGKLANITHLPLRSGPLPTLVRSRQKWGFLEIHASGGAGKGFTTGGEPLGFVTTAEDPPLLLLQTHQLPGKKAVGLAFWPPSAKAHLKWGFGQSKELLSGKTLSVRPGVGGIEVR